jgi:NAD(P)-dependent dehydrogenase (short-subunit alcohol dehydrogenase family)
MKTYRTETFHAKKPDSIIYVLCCFIQAAMDSLTRSLALEWARNYSIRVNAIASRPISHTAGLFQLDPKTFPRLVNLPPAREMVPLGRLGEAWDIALAVLYVFGKHYIFLSTTFS